jgi:hypothetical protein
VCSDFFLNNNSSLEEKQTLFLQKRGVLLLSVKVYRLTFGVIEEEDLFFVTSSSFNSKLLTGRTTTAKKHLLLFYYQFERRKNRCSGKHCFFFF